MKVAFQRLKQEYVKLLKSKKVGGKGDGGGGGFSVWHVNSVG